MPGFFRGHAALPQQHGSWALWLAPYAVGVGVGGDPGPALAWLTLAILGGFLSIQPLTLLVKIQAGRRPLSDSPLAWSWLGIWLLTAAAGGTGLFVSGHSRILWLIAPALPVLAWQMWLVRNHTERRQMAAEIAAAGVLTLAAPSACLVSGGPAQTAGWLWLLCWLQATGSIVYVYLRLEQRKDSSHAVLEIRLRRSVPAIACHLGNMAVVSALVALRRVPGGAVIPFLVLLLEAIYGAWFAPALGARPAKIGIRQVFVHALFAALMVSAYSAA